MFRKINTLFLFVGLLVNQWAAACSELDIVLSSQDQIDRFSVDYPDCTAPRSLLIEEASPGSIKNLTGLFALQSVAGKLQVFRNSALESLTGLEGLTSVGDDLDLFSNDRLRTLDGLDNLRSVGGFLDVSFSDYLTDIDALSNVDRVGTFLRLFHLYGLHDCRGIAPYINTLPLAERSTRVKLGDQGDLPRNGTGANAIQACLNSAELLTSSPSLRGQRPNVLFFLLDDVGLDQLATFGYGGAVPPPTPAIDQIAQAGVTFDNVWAMPECSPTRVALFTGQLPLISGTTGALGTSDLANSQLSPYTETLADKLKIAGYTSAMVGKWHLGGPEYNEAGLTTPIEAGFDYYWGNVHGFLRSIDSSAGGIAPTGTYSCGFVPGTADDPNNGADSGACYTARDQCQIIASGAGVDAPGRSCMEQGGLFVPDTACETSAPEALDFDKENAYYVGKLESMAAPADPSRPVEVSEFITRGYRTSLESDEAIRWVNERAASGPWFLTVSYSAAHTPLQQIPQNLLATDITPSGLDCTAAVDQRVLQKGIIAAISQEIGRVLMETGLATDTGPGGSLQLTPKADSTVIIIAGDNGSLGPMVDLPFDPTRAKGTVYQTGVKVPLIIAGGGVSMPNVTRHHLLSLIDLYGMILDMAGLPLPTGNAPFNPVSPLPLLDNALQAAPRASIAVNVEPNLQVGGTFNPPCDISGGCTVVPISKSVCEDNNGLWYGPGADGLTRNGGNPIPASGFDTCWQANQFLHSLGEPPMNIPPTIGYAAANETHKLVRTYWTDYDPDLDGPAESETLELFQITDGDGAPRIDYAASNLLTSELSSTSEVQLAFEELSNILSAYIASGTFPSEDGNRDGVVNDQDLLNAQAIAAGWGESSRYDVNLDGRTDGLDLQRIILAIQAATGIPLPVPVLPGLGLAFLVLLVGGLLVRYRAQR